MSIGEVTPSSIIINKSTILEYKENECKRYKDKYRAENC